MNQKLLIAWAVSATVVALLAIGYALGKSARLDTSAPASARSTRVDTGNLTTDSTDTSEGRPTMQPIDTFVVPAAFTGMPGEWRSRFDGEHFEGYTVLFDAARREVIVEQCRHPGYYDKKRGLVLDGGWDFCEGVIWGSLRHIDESSAIVADRTGVTIDIDLALNADSRPPKLALTFGDHDMALEPGSKNDLLQAMERSPQIMEQKDLVAKAIATQQRAQRRVAEGSADGRAVEIPTYSLPDRKGMPEENGSDRE